jgi:pseudouridylate synthase
VNKPDSSYFVVSRDVRRALVEGMPVVALESAVLTHGLPLPQNLEAAEAMWKAVRSEVAVPAICLVSRGKLLIGASLEEATELTRDQDREKVSVRELGTVLASGACGGLTVSATLFAAHLAGIRVFATGGIGGVHHGDAGDVSSDLQQLAHTPVVTVCSGAKSVLDIPRTLELLETLGVPVLGYQTSDFPAFYVERSGLTVREITTPGDVARIAELQGELGYESGILLANPIPSKDAISSQEWSGWLAHARREAELKTVRGKDLTPFLLARVAAASEGQTIRANLALLEANAGLAAQVAAAMVK